MPQAAAPHSPLGGRVSLERKLELLEARFTAAPGDESDAATTLTSPLQMHSYGFDAPVLLGGGGGGAGSRSNLSASIQEVNLAAARQMVRAAERGAGHGGGGGSHLSAVDGDDDGSAHTLPTAHLSHRPAVATPPPPSAEEHPEDGAHHPDKGRRKRKTTPVKFDLPSVKDTFGSRRNLSKATSSNSRDAAPVVSKDATVKAETRKRGRSSASATASAEPALAPPPTEVAVAVASAAALTLSPMQVHNSNSREAKKRNVAPAKPPSSNHLISNYFKSQNASKPSVSTGTATSDPTMAASASVASRATALQPARVSLGADSGTTLVASSSHDPLAALQERCRELEGALQDTTEQLAAIRNHRSILHANLTVSLERCQGELAARTEAHAAETERLTRIVEQAVRKQAEEDAAAVRASLAVNGARLGQIVMQRVGMRTVEAWQDGQATKAIQANKAKLRKERKSLEQRKEAAQRAFERFTRNKNEKRDALRADVAEHEDETIGGIVVRNQIEAMEALESVQYHLANLSRREKELITEEQALNLEKAAHVRGLKRVNSEDNSRFRSRPKLHDRYVLQSLLGKGGFSEVWRAYDLVELRDVAVKIHQLDPRWSDSKKENYTKHISREYEIHKNVRHPRIVSLFDVFEIDNNSFATVLECCSGGDLDVLLKERKTLAERDARAILLQVLLGMQYLSQPSVDGTRKGIIHYDLKPGNILFDENGDAKITDFGLSKIVDTVDSAESMELTSQGAGTYWYLPPECFITDDNVRISSKVDVWSIGTIYYQMLFGRRPFGEGQSQDRILKDQTMLNAHHVSFPHHPPISEEGKEFIRTCLAYEQSCRPTIAQLCGLPYLFMDLKEN